MKTYESAEIRNVALLGHGRAGKSSVAETALFNTGASKRLGKLEEGTLASDYEPEETRRKMSLSLSLLAVEWMGAKVNLLDAPGYPDFVGETKGAMQAADTALIIVSGASGVEAETEKAWQWAEEAALPRAFFLNKMDLERADFHKVLDELRVRYGQGVVPIQLPVGKASALQGVVDLLAMTVRIKERDKNHCVTRDEVPEYMQEEIDEARQTLFEGVAEIDDSLMEKYINGEDVPEEDTAKAIIAGMQAGKLFPVLCGSALKNVGMHALLTDIVEYFPSPAERVAVGSSSNAEEEIMERPCDGPFSAQVFKTVIDPFVGKLSYLRLFSGELHGDMSVQNASRGRNERVGSLYTLQGKKQIPLHTAFAGDIVIAPKLPEAQTGDTLAAENAPIVYERPILPEPMLSMALYPKNKGEEDKLYSSLAKQIEEDQTLRSRRNTETKEVVVSGIGEVHLDVLLERLKRKYGVEGVLQEAKVPYRETIKKTVKAEGKHKKQSGGHGQYGHVLLEISPQNKGAGNAFTETIFGGSVPRQFIPAIEKGVAETLAAGIFAGYPVVDVKVNLYDGSYHTVDSSEVAFKAATEKALKKGVMEAEPTLLEPIYQVEVEAPEYYTGDVIGQLNSKRARILGMENIARGLAVVKAEVPLASLSRYATELRSLTQGRGTYTAHFERYEEVPTKIAETIVEVAHKK